MGNPTVLNVVIMLVIVSSIGLVLQSVWRHKKAQAVFFFGVLFLVGYLVIQVLAWKDASAVHQATAVGSSAKSMLGMAGFTNVAYDASAWIGFVLIAVGGVLHLQGRRKAPKTTTE